MAVGQAPIVRGIEFIGYERTKLYILEREIQHPINVPLNIELAQADRQRLENLGIFSLVSLQILNKNKQDVILRYTVIESWRYLPMFTPVYNEQWGWSVGAMLRISNFRGRNESLILRGQYGGQNTIGISFTNPWITGDHVSLQIGIGNNLYQHLFLPYDINGKYLQIGVGQYLNNYLRGKIGLKIIDRKYTNEDITRHFRYVTPFFNVIYDSRDLYANPSRGIIWNQNLQYSLDVIGDTNNRLVWNQSTGYFNEILGGERNTVIGINVASTLSFAQDLDVWNNYIGGAYSVRGWSVPNSKLYSSGDQSYRFGMDLITTTVELRQTLIPKSITKYKSEFGLAVAAFTDVGYINNDLSQLFQKSPLVGVGIGVRIPWPVVQTVRLDYGWSFYQNKYVEQALHLAFGEKF